MGGGRGDRVGDTLDAAKATVKNMVAAASLGGPADEDDREAAMRRERLGRTNAERDRASGRSAAPGRWDWAGDDGEGLDELQDRYAPDAEQPDPAEQEVARADGRRGDPEPEPGRWPAPVALWDRLVALEGRTVRTAKGEPFKVAAVERGAGITVVPLDGGQRWVVAAAELEAAAELFAGGEPADRLAPIRLRAEGVAASHPEYVAALFRALDAGE